MRPLYRGVVRRDFAQQGGSGNVVTGALQVPIEDNALDRCVRGEAGARIIGSCCRDDVDLGTLQLFDKTTRRVARGALVIQLVVDNEGAATEIASGFQHPTTLLPLHARAYWA